ncbi:hypothetical protein [Gordonia aurantiaca]|uniref:hypothetical protein n=1 Tax=Gordonia sp. B21 TaxID=3151852 RepID=UPI0032673117
MTGTHLRTLAATLLIAAAATGLGACTTEGTPLADPSELSATPTGTSSSDDDLDSESSSPYSTAPSTPTSTRPPISEVPPPPNSASITCREFVEMDKSHQIAVLIGVGATRNFETVANLLGILCPATPDETVYNMLHKRPR